MSARKPFITADEMMNEAYGAREWVSVYLLVMEAAEAGFASVEVRIDDAEVYREGLEAGGFRITRHPGQGFARICWGPK
jgi:hypothetical protein